MFGTIITVDPSGEILLEKDYIHLVPEFNEVYKDKNLGGTMIKWIINVYDHKSPFRHLPLEVRKEDMAEKFFGKKKYSRCNHPKVKKAVELYEYCQYNPLRHEYDSLVNKHAEKIEVYNKIEVTDKNLKGLSEIEAKMMASGQELEKLKKRLVADEEENKMMGNDTANLSFIEERLIKFRKEKQGT